MYGRTYYCGEVPEEAIGEKVVLKGWAQRRRDLGGLIFIDFRDRTGIVQIVFSPDFSKEALETAEKIRSEYVLMWKERLCPGGRNNKSKLKTGKVEVQVDKGYNFK